MTRKQTTKRLANALYSVSEQNNVLDLVHHGLNTLKILVKTDSRGNYCRKHTKYVMFA